MRTSTFYCEIFLKETSSARPCNYVVMMDIMLVYLDLKVVTPAQLPAGGELVVEDEEHGTNDRGLLGPGLKLHYTTFKINLIFCNKKL